MFSNSSIDNVKMKSLNIGVDLYLFLVIKCALSDGYTFHQFVRKSTFDGFIKATDYIQRQSVSGAIHCGTICSKHTKCESIFFTNDTMTCELHNTTIPNSATDELQLSTTTVYYARKDDVFFACPENNGSWTEARLTSGSSYMFKLFRNTTVSQAEAVAACSSVGENLLKILTKEKMDFVRNNLTKCADVSGYSYWIDGSNVEASDPYALDAYRTVDNETVPMGSDFWYPGLPDHPHLCRCIWISDVFGYAFDDVTCLHEWTTGVYHICEKSLD